MASVLLIFYLHTPGGNHPVSQIMVLAMVVPVLGVSDLLMWQMPRLRRLRQRRAARRER